MAGNSVAILSGALALTACASSSGEAGDDGGLTEGSSTSPDAEAGALSPLPPVPAGDASCGEEAEASAMPTGCVQGASCNPYASSDCVRALGDGCSTSCTCDACGQRQCTTSCPSADGGCAGWTEDIAFAQLRAQGVALGRVYGAWASAENDLHVALGVEDGQTPSSGAPAVAHWDGKAWRLDVLPLTGDVAGVAGTSARDLWVLATNPAPAILRNDGAAGAWVVSPLPRGYAAGFDLTVLGPEHAVLSAQPSAGAPGGGSVLEWDGGTWSVMMLPSDNEPYVITQLRAADAAHVVGRGTVTAPALGNVVFDAFDGASWTSRLAGGTAGPPSAGNPGLFIDDVAVTSAAAYATTESVYAVPGGIEIAVALRTVWTVSAGGGWTQLAQTAFGSNAHALAATSNGSVLAVWTMADTPGSWASLAEVRGGSVTYSTFDASWGHVVALSAPGSPCVHVFAAAPSGTGEAAHDWTARLDP